MSILKQLFGGAKVPDVPQAEPPQWSPDGHSGDLVPGYCGGDEYGSGGPVVPKDWYDQALRDLCVAEKLAGNQLRRILGLQEELARHRCDRAALGAAICEFNAAADGFDAAARGQRGLAGVTVVEALCVVIRAVNNVILIIGEPEPCER